MLEQKRHAREGPTARLAAVLLDVRMRLQMGAQVGTVSKRAAAMRAGERFLSGMCADVTLE